MSNQDDLFKDHPTVTKYQKHSQTSRLAAYQIEEAAETLRGSVLRWIRDSRSFGATDEQIQIGLGMNPSTQRPRRVELVERGLIKNSGRTRKTRSNRLAVVWILNLTGEER